MEGITKPPYSDKAGPLDDAVRALISSSPEQPLGESEAPDTATKPWTRERIASLVEVAASTLDNWRRGERKPERDRAMRLAAVVCGLGASRLKKANIDLSPADVLKVWGYSFEKREYADTLAQLREKAETSSGDDLAWSVGRYLKGWAVPSLADKHLKGVLRYGVDVAASTGLKLGDFDHIQERIRLALQRDLTSADTHEGFSVSDLEPYWVGDESWSYCGLHTDFLVLVCPRCTKHKGLVLKQTTDGQPVITPSRADKADETILGSILCRLHVPVDSERNRVVRVGTPRPHLVIGMPPWADAVLVARLLQRRAVSPKDLVVQPSDFDCDFVTRSGGEGYEELEKHLKHGLVDGVLGTEDFAKDNEVEDVLDGSAVYVYPGNRLLARDTYCADFVLELFFPLQEKESPPADKEALQSVFTRMRNRSGKPVKVGVRQQEDDLSTLDKLLLAANLQDLVEKVVVPEVDDLGDDVLLLWYGDAKPAGYLEVLGTFAEDVRRREQIHLFVRKDLDAARKKKCKALGEAAREAVRQLSGDRAGLSKLVQEVNFVLSEPLDFRDFRVPLAADQPGIANDDSREASES